MANAASKLRSPAQNNRMWGLLAELQRRAGLSREDAERNLRAKIREISGQEHSSRLTYAQAEAVNAYLQKEVDRYTAAAATPNAAPSRKPFGPRGPGPRRQRLITQKQQLLIRGLFLQLGWSEMERQRGFSMRQVKKPWPQTMEEADALIEGLKGMVLREVKPAEAWRRVRALLGRPELTDYEAKFVVDVHQQFVDAEARGALHRVLTPGKVKVISEALARVPSVLATEGA